MPRRAITLSVLGLLIGCGATAQPRHARPLRGPVAGGVAPLVAAADADVTGRWTGPEWGSVVLNPDGTGTYTDTFGTGPGRIEYRSVADGYEGRWMESSRRFGTLRFVLAPSGREIIGTWTPDPECTIGTPNGGALRWMREASP